jgi:hypothetical protein
LDSFDHIDVGLLFKSVVILPQDSTEKTPKILVEKELGEPQSYKEKKSINEISEPQKTLSKPYQLCAIFTTKELKKNYTANGSSFQKILEALKISSAKKHLITDINLDELKEYKCVWCVGLSHDMETKILKIKHPNLLLSPNILDLKTKEEKMAMYNPLKEFVTQNINLFSST